MAGEAIVRMAHRTAWRAWLERHHATSPNVMLAVGKKGASVPVVPYADAVEEALCFGWIDSTAASLDDDAYLVRMGRRKPGSGWSEINKGRIERMIAAGRMTPAGLAVIDAARADGSWEKLDRVKGLQVPRDLVTALEAYPEAERHFDAFPRSARWMILHWIDDAKRPETRAKRIEETARLANENVRAHQPQPKGKLAT